MRDWHWVQVKHHSRDIPGRHRAAVTDGLSLAELQGLMQAAENGVIRLDADNPDTAALRQMLAPADPPVRA